MKNIFTLLLIAFGFQCALAQDEAIFNHYQINPILINPSLAGFGETHHLQMNLRNQWVGFPGAPATYMVSYNGPIGKTLGIGIGALSENVAQVTRFKFLMNYAFRYQINDLKFAAGFSTELQRIQLASSVKDQGENLYQPGDFIIENAIDGVRLFDASLGLFGQFRETTYFGLSFPNLVQARLDDIVTSDEAKTEFFRYYIFHLGHKFMFDDYNFKLEPSIMIRKIRNTPFQVDFNLLTGFLNDQVQAGVSYRSGTGGAIGIILGTRISALSAYYSYDVSFQRFQQYNGGSHEVTVAFDFKAKKKDKKAKRSK
jgi:type IX secretion system PorP/SprF family membrane protein